MDYRKKFDLYEEGYKKRKEFGLFATDVDFKIKIDNPDFDFWKYRDKLYRATYDELEYKRYKDNCKYEKSPFEFFVRERLKRFSKKENVSLVVTDYTEREGSLIITFSFFVFTAFMNYGQFRESMEYLQADFKYFLRDVFPSDTNISINFNDRPNHLLEDIEEVVFRQPFEAINRELRRLKLIMMSIVFCGFLVFGFSFYTMYQNSEKTASPPTDREVIQSIISPPILFTAPLQ